MLIFILLGSLDLVKYVGSRHQATSPTPETDFSLQVTLQSIAPVFY